jgi:putative DNA methylase
VLAKGEERRLEKRFIESVNFPFNEVSVASAVEKGPGRPSYWEMVFWWTRKPLISARAVIAGCLLPEPTKRAAFLSSIRIKNKGPPHKNEPFYRFEDITLLDPFAGFGSIPLEALRLGLSATAVELIPTPYVFLKAALAHPLKYGKNLLSDVERWGSWVTERLREDPDMKDLYDKDVATYVCSWQVKCPNCGRWTPLVGSWWLVRAKNKKGYQRLAWMTPRIVGDRIEIEVMDLNLSLGDKVVKKANVDKNTVTVSGVEYRVPESNIDPRRDQAVCLLCSQPIKYLEKETGKHIMDPSSGRTKKLIWYVKYALIRYNEGNEDLAKPILLVKVCGRRFEPCTEQDRMKLDMAKQKAEKLLQQGDPYVPTEDFVPYGHSEGGQLSIPIYGFNKFYKLFNHRQLLVSVKLVKLINRVGELAKKEKLMEGRLEEATSYAEAVTTYLAMALCSVVDFNSVSSQWQASAWQPVKRSFAMRGLVMQWNYSDSNPFSGNTGSWSNALGNVLTGLGFLNRSLAGTVGLSREVNVLLDDATLLNKLGPDEKFDLIVTDPPYYGDVAYAESSDFYYVWLKRALSDEKNGTLVPRFMREAFFERIGDDWGEVSTQWAKYALSEVSLNVLRLGANAIRHDGLVHFQNLLNTSFSTMTSRLKQNGLLVTYYAHTDPDAWKSLLIAGWEAAGLRITNAFPIATESTQSVVSRGKLSMDTSIVVVWRKGSEGPKDAAELFADMVEQALERARELLELGAIGRDLVIGTLAAALMTATQYREIRVMGRIDVGTLIGKYVYPATYLGLARALARKAELKDGIKSPDGMFYLLVKSTLAGAKRKTLDSTDSRIFSIGTSLDLDTATKNWRILKAGEKESGAKVAKAKTLTLVEPSSTEKSKLAELLESRGVGVSEPKVRCTVDALHLLEYLAVVHPKETFRRKLDELRLEFPTHIEEGLTLARILGRILPPEDVEKSLCGRIAEYLEPVTPRIDKYSSQEGL